MLRAIHNLNWYQGAELKSHFEAIYWLRRHNPKLYHFGARIGSYWLKVVMPTDDNGQESIVSKIFANRVELKYNWKTKKWELK